VPCLVYRKVTDHSGLLEKWEKGIGMKIPNKTEQIRGFSPFVERMPVGGNSVNGFKERGGNRGGRDHAGTS